MFSLIDDFLVGVGNGAEAMHDDQNGVCSSSLDGSGPMAGPVLGRGCAF